MKFGDFAEVYNGDIRIEVKRPTHGWENNPRNTYNVSYGWLSDYYRPSQFGQRYEAAQARRMGVLESLDVQQIGNGYIVLNGCTPRKTRRYWE